MAAASVIGSRGAGGTLRRGIAFELRRLPGAIAARVIEPSDSEVPEHSHEWPVLSLYVAGCHRKRFDGGETVVAGPSAVFHAANEPHSNLVDRAGMEQVDIMYDPSWLRGAGIPLEAHGVRCWVGGRVALAASRLGRLWAAPNIAEDRLAGETAAFLSLALATRAPRHPRWFDELQLELAAGRFAGTRDLARRFGLHPAWLRNAYRQLAGEGLQETVRRRRVERATELLRSTDWPAAEIAAACGFYDQSHMVRCFRHTLARRPSQVRQEREAFLGTASPPN